MRQKYVLGATVWLMVLATAIATISAAELKRLEKSVDVVRAMRDQPDKAIPDKLWQRAACVAIIPDVKKAALGVGGEYGKGVMSCRNGHVWGAPVFMQLAKGSWGLQIGATEMDVVLLVMNREGAEKLLKNQVSLGADASAAAGPVGRAATAGTDAQMTAEILSYSRSKGIFAGIDISGGMLGPDKDANADVYGATRDAKEIAFGSVKVPPEAQPLVKELNRQAVGTSGK